MYYCIYHFIIIFCVSNVAIFSPLGSLTISLDPNVSKSNGCKYKKLKRTNRNRKCGQQKLLIQD